MRKIRSGLKKLAQPIVRQRYIGPLLRMLFSVWKGPYTRTSLHEARVALDSLKKIVSDGYGPAIQGLENGVRGHELTIRQMSEKIEQVISNHENTTSRIELIRNELSLELDKHLKNPLLNRTNSTPKIQPRFINLEKLNVSGLKKLNLGCGNNIREDFINVDYRDLHGVDLISDVASLPFEKGSVSVIYATHLIEHFSEKTLRDVVLSHWYELLAIGGELRLSSPAAHTTINGYIQGEFSFEHLRTILFGSQEYEGDYRFTMYTAEKIVELLKEVGFMDIIIKNIGIKSGSCYEFEVIAKR